MLFLVVGIMALIAWEPNPGRQTTALTRSEYEILYGGARGGGKTDAGLVWMVEPNYVRNELYRGLVIRKNADDLSDWIARARIMYRGLGARVTGASPVIRFPHGGFIRTGHLKDKTSYEKYLGHEYQKLLIEELTQIGSEDDYEKLISCARSTVEGLPAGVFCTTNPGGRGHVWVKRRWVDVARNKTYYTPGGRSRIFIPSTIDDNPVLMQKDPKYVKSIEAIKDPNLRAAWRHGDWDRFSGQFFDMWDPSIHVVEPFLIPYSWKRSRGLDWGYAAPACVLWLAIDYTGNHYVYREYYEAGNAPSGMARKVTAMSPREETILNTWADPSIWAKSQYGTGANHEQQTTESIEDIFRRGGLYCSKANNDRLSGWARVKDLLSHDAKRKPKLFVFKNCVKLIETLPGLVYSDTKVEDMDTDGEDHAADALRYCVMHTHVSARPQEEKPMMEKIIDKITQDAQPAGAGSWDNY